MNDSLFLELLHCGTGANDCLSKVSSMREWGILFEEVQRQAIVGYLTEGLERLPKEQLPPQPILLQYGIINIKRNILYLSYYP